MQTLPPDQEHKLFMKRRIRINAVICTGVFVWVSVMISTGLNFAFSFYRVDGIVLTSLSIFVLTGLPNILVWFGLNDRIDEQFSWWNVISTGAILILAGLIGADGLSPFVPAAYTWLTFFVFLIFLVLSIPINYALLYGYRQ